MSEAQIQSFERAGYKMSGFNKRQTEANYMKAERKVYTQEHVRFVFPIIDRTPRSTITRSGQRTVHIHSGHLSNVIKGPDG